MYNVDIDGVNHIKDESHIVLGTYAVRLSEKAGLYQPGAPMVKGDMHDITVRNVFSKCRYGVALYNELCNITVENVTAINGVALAAPADEVCTVYGLKTNNLRTNPKLLLDINMGPTNKLFSKTIFDEETKFSEIYKYEDRVADK